LANHVFAGASSEEEEGQVKARTMFGWNRWRPALALLALVAGLSMVVAACGGSDNSNTSSAGGGSTSTAAAKPAAAASKCGLGNGKKATGTPIKLGGIATKQPGTDFTDIPNTAKAYFDCVNDNGGINGRPIDYSLETEQTDPGQVAAAAKKLIESDKVLGIVGNTSIIDCTVNHKYYESKGFYIIDSGIAPECYGTSNSAPVNMGPRYSVDGAAQYLIRQKVKKIVLDQANVPGTGYVAAGAAAISKDAGVDFKDLHDNVPIQDANSVALKAVQAAGSGGGVLLNFTPPEALKILQAAQRQGLQDRVKWACSTPCNTDFLADALGSAWDGKLGVNAELNLTNADGPDSQLYRDVLKKYAPKVPLGSFSQMGFVEAAIATKALLGVQGDYTAKSVNDAFKAVKGFKTDILCKPWYYGDGPTHVPNNTDRTTTPQGGKMVEKEGCFDISDVDPGIKAVRDWESQNGIS
jgi:branched-chain amino acid transport system substrate-binding protein